MPADKNSLLSTFRVLLCCEFKVWTSYRGLLARFRTLPLSKRDPCTSQCRTIVTSVATTWGSPIAVERVVHVSPALTPSHTWHSALLSPMAGSCSRKDRHGGLERQPEGHSYASCTNILSLIEFSAPNFGDHNKLPQLHAFVQGLSWVCVN